MSTHGPASRPCGSCPYRRDVPSGVWATEEYDKLPDYDLDTGEQPFGAFYCHQQNGRLCAGWVGCHDMEESLGLRMALTVGALGQEDYEAALDYECVRCRCGARVQRRRRSGSGRSIHQALKPSERSTN